MSDRSEAEISEAVRDGVLRCAKAPDVDKCIADYASALAALGWSEADVEAVVKSTRKVLDSIGPQIQ